VAGVGGPENATKEFFLEFVFSKKNKWLFDFLDQKKKQPTFCFSKQTNFWDDAAGMPNGILCCLVIANGVGQRHIILPSPLMRSTLHVGCRRRAFIHTHNARALYTHRQYAHRARRRRRMRRWALPQEAWVEVLPEMTPGPKRYPCFNRTCVHACVIMCMFRADGVATERRAEEATYDSWV
jgi:hypothetical protein